jgi:hypothetical protein
MRSMRLVRTVCLVALLAVAWSYESPTEAYSQFGQCPLSGCDQFFPCMDMCDSGQFHCWMGCQGYPNPYRHECEDQCYQGWGTCMDSCFYCEWCV